MSLGLLAAFQRDVRDGELLVPVRRGDGMCMQYLQVDFYLSLTSSLLRSPSVSLSNFCYLALIWLGGVGLEIDRCLDWLVYLFLLRRILERLGYPG